jgi:hypothetical protein
LQIRQVAHLMEHDMRSRLWTLELEVQHPVGPIKSLLSQLLLSHCV